jgi:hypothetical protein
VGKSFGPVAVFCENDTALIFLTEEYIATAEGDCSKQNIRAKIPNHFPLATWVS